jgi:hypothetical protein
VLPADAARLFLLVDQFEELFTACKDLAERRAFVDNLLHATAPETAGPAPVVRHPARRFLCPLRAIRRPA